MTTVSEANARGPLVNIASWITLVSAILAAGVKLYTKMSITKKVQLDDALLLVAVLAAVGCCIAQAKQVQFGLGQHEDSLTSGQISSYYLSYYVTQIFYVVTVYVAKLVGLYFFISLTGENVKRKIVRCLMVFIGAWTTAAIFVVAFQCELPRPWKNPSSQKCVNKLAFWTVNGVVDILTQLCVGLLPVYLLAGLQLRKTKKIFSMLSFTPNMLFVNLSQFTL
ncbi:MAG: hypothetical protein LQ342_000012 [Letrouitia transgressa]|nr:MAG: hypothetical protein LQ342_000012 [Letrouitia transgressa]